MLHNQQRAAYQQPHAQPASICDSTRAVYYCFGLWMLLGMPLPAQMLLTGFAIVVAAAAYVPYGNLADGSLSTSSGFHSNVRSSISPSALSANRASGFTLLMGTATL